MSTLKLANIKSQTNNSAITIASDGTATMTNTPTTSSRPYFHAYGTGTQAWSGSAAYATVQFSGVWENSGSHYNTSTYKFTCPRAGVYFFWYTYTNSTNSSTGPQAYIVYTSGGSSSFRSGVIQYGDYYNTVGDNAVITCAANATVEVKLSNLNDVSFTLDNTRCSFGGYLIG